MQTLLSVPPALSSGNIPLPATDFVTHDPPGQKLGSGGGTAHLLREAANSLAPEISFADWVQQGQNLLLHAGGQSRRLPAYAASGKALIPVPVFRWSTGQRLDQTLLDLQKPLLSALLQQAPPSLNTLVASGDVLVWNDAPLPALPEVDVLCVGLWDSPETATRHGVFFTPRAHPEQFEFMLQKPSTAEIQRLASEFLFLLDVGIWLFSPKAVDVLMRKCGWDPKTGAFAGGLPAEFDLYTTFGQALGRHPTHADPEISALSCAVLPLGEANFYHFGTNADMIKSALALQNRVHDQRRIRTPLIKPHPSIFVQNATTACRLDAANHEIWVENAHIGANWTLTQRHVLTGIPENDWTLQLPPGLCIDCVPVGDTQYGLRVYGFDDPFRGQLDDPETQWMGQTASAWFQDRGLPLPEVTDLQQAPLFPILSADQLTENMVNWMVHGSCSDPESAKSIYESARKCSAETLATEANLARQFHGRNERLNASLPALARNAERSIFHQIDLDHAAERFAQTGADLPEEHPDPVHNLFGFIHDKMFRAEVMRHRNVADNRDAGAAFSALREAIIAPYRDQNLCPRNTAMSDQVIWARSPVRLDLAGGWTDTPPTCFFHGGQVVNLAVELNGQPPIQVFARPCEEHRITLRSIDLGITEHLDTYEDIAAYATLGDGFSIPKAALALAGFHPDFQTGRNWPTLADQLREFGGGIELSLLCAVPKGSGLGTSSILAASVLGALSELCGLGWDITEMGNRTLALEQMLTSGGGWQDQFGGITRGLKLLRTAPGLDQTPEIRWLPDHLFTDPVHKNNFLLYYTGVTRVAHTLLEDIVRGMFLNRREQVQTLELLGHHARETYEVLQKGDFAALGRKIRRTWQLNQQLDAGTNPPVIRDLIHRIDDYAHGMKLLGAGGGGYLLIAAKDPACTVRIRELLQTNPPNERARFVDFDLSRHGLQVTRS
ncbi:MAG: bifunctional fucokinase/L-fucose-1-P-guanylyltransferase [Verrucomicrobia bacterium]|nr:bifunctional fucokinase/L-fucose-1-P-guanylyltransferase [Verrucomicrobiota bacterium]MCH8510567.1 bifunctional fucokinase/L-fucose-1-P-guanylyltransferase [Kiritimatiellia bacterium]